jgi:hypothetical protein
MQYILSGSPHFNTAKNRGKVDKIVTQLIILVTTFTPDFPGCLGVATNTNSGIL